MRACVCVCVCVCQVLVREYEAPEGVTTTTDVGKIEKIKVSKAFGATSEVSLNIGLVGF